MKWKLSLLILPIITSSMITAQGKYDFNRLRTESLDRGVVAVRTSPDEVAVSWRYLPEDGEKAVFDVYRNGKKINRSPLKKSTYFIDNNSSKESATYEVRLRGKDKNGSWVLPPNAPTGYIEIPTEVPPGDVDPFGHEYAYLANDASIGDVDGDGQYEIFLKWEPTNAHDNAHDGFTGSTYIDCIRLDGTRLWRVDLGYNIRSGAHYNPFLVADFDGDGCAELICKTADRTIDGEGNMIGDRKADWRNIKGRIIAGPEYLTVFDGLTGRALSTVEYLPQRGELRDWGDSYANRSERYLAAMAFLDGEKPSAVMCRGYYAKTSLAAYDWDGRELKLRWLFDSTGPGNEAYASQGNHNLRVADVDGDGCDEIIYGQMAIDHDGKGLYSTGMYHGDAMHILSDTENERYYIWGCHENHRDGSSLRDAATGEVIFQFPSNKDIGRCMAADIDPSSPGIELWSPCTGGIRSFSGGLVSPGMKFRTPTSTGVPVNMGVWWDGDLLREMLDRNVISKYDPASGDCNPIYVMDEAESNNWTKATPCLEADIIGDWREEVLMRATDNKSLRLYVTSIPTDYRFHSFLLDPVYRTSVANQNVGYNQPAEPGFYFGPDLKGRKFRGTKVK